MISNTALESAKKAFDIEAECINEMKNYLDDGAFSKAVELLCNAERIGAAGCAGAAFLSFCRLRNKFWSWPIFLLLTLLTTATGMQTLHTANEVIEVSFGQLQFYPAALLPFHLLWSLLPPAD